MALGKKGRVAKVYKDGDIVIAISSQSWRLNPALVSIVNQVGIESVTIRDCIVPLYLIVVN